MTRCRSCHRYRVPRGRIRICVRCRWSLNRALRGPVYRVWDWSGR